MTPAPPNKTPAPPNRALTRTQVACVGASRSLARYDGPLIEDLAAPHPPRLGAVESRTETTGTDGALRAQCLGLLEFGRSFGEPEIGVGCPARQVAAGGRDLDERDCSRSDVGGSYCSGGVFGFHADCLGRQLGLLVLGCETVSHDMGSMGANLSRVGNQMKRAIQHKGHGPQGLRVRGRK